MKSIESQCEKAFQAYPDLGIKTAKEKNLALTYMAQGIKKNISYILQENKKDLELGKTNGLSNALLDRLSLTESRINEIIQSFKIIQDQPDPIGQIISGWTLPNGLKISQTRVPLGVIGIIYEARPNVTADAIALCIKTGNCIVLRGSASAYNSNYAITKVLKNAVSKAGLSKDAIQLLEDTSRESVKTFLQQNKFLNVIIPRGGSSLIKFVVENATVPTIETGSGICHIFIDSSANQENAIKICLNAKVQRPSVCNACETILIHQDIAKEFLPKLAKNLKSNKVTIRGCSQTTKIIKDIEKATEKDWDTEYLDLIVSIKIVSDIEDAVKHIQKHSTKHTEAIISQNYTSISTFKTKIDASTIMVNASTRFTDGSEFGFGAEMGISTQKLHARGPMGLKELTSYKYIVEGSGQIRE